VGRSLAKRDPHRKAPEAEVPREACLFSMTGCPGVRALRGQLRRRAAASTGTAYAVAAGEDPTGNIPRVR
jgi:hypothetical protein